MVQIERTESIHRSETESGERSTGDASFGASVCDAGQLVLLGDAERDGEFSAGGNGLAEQGQLGGVLAVDFEHGDRVAAGIDDEEVVAHDTDGALGGQGVWHGRGPGFGVDFGAAVPACGRQGALAQGAVLADGQSDDLVRFGVGHEVDGLGVGQQLDGAVGGWGGALDAILLGAGDHGGRGQGGEGRSQGQQGFDGRHVEC